MVTAVHYKWQHKETQITAERNTINTHCTIYMSQSSHALCTKTGHNLYHKLYLYGLDDPWFSQHRQDMFLSSKTSRTALARNQLLLNGYHRPLALGYSRWSIKLTTHLHLMPRRVSQAIHLLLLYAFVMWTTCEFHKLCHLLDEAYEEGDEAVAW